MRLSSGVGRSLAGVLVVATLSVGLAIGAEPAGAATFTVTVTADTNDGVCNSHCSLREALAVADSTPGPDTVVIPSGTYAPSTYGYWSASDDVTLVGAGVGSTTLTMMGIPYCTHIVTSASLVVQDLSLQGVGSACRPSWCVDYSSAFKSTGSGSLTVQNVSTYNLSALAYVGTDTGSFEFPTVTVDDLSAVLGSGEPGGFLFVDTGGVLRVSNSSFNDVKLGVLLLGGLAMLDRVTFTSGPNYGDVSCPPVAGNFSNGGGTLSISRSTISGGQYDQAVANSAGTTIISQSLLQPGPYQPHDQISVTGGSVTVDNSTITSGVAWGGADVAVSGGSLTLRRSTVSHNTDSAIDQGGSGVVNLEGSIISDNGGANCTVFVTSLGYNLDDDNTCGLNMVGDQVSVNPLLGPLTNNGGWTMTRLPSAASPATNSIPSSVLPLCSGTDQRGVTRPKQGACEKGAVERTWKISYNDTALTLPSSLLQSGDVGVTTDVFGVSKVSLPNGEVEVDGVTYSVSVEVSRLFIFPVGIGRVSISGGGQQRTMIYLGSLAAAGAAGVQMQGLGLSFSPFQILPVTVTLEADG